jgi:hypothetical protein
MLTPKHRALFAAAYGGAILRTAGDEPQPPPAGAVPGDLPAAKDDDPGSEPPPQ